MSSMMPPKSKLLSEGRSKMFLRSNSFQKLCSLAHPMRLRGFKSNREALKSVFESLIVTTRGVIQTVTYRILCFLFLTPFTRLVTRPGIARLVDCDGKFKTLRLILKLTLSMIISTDKDPKGKELHINSSGNVELQADKDITAERTTSDAQTETTRVDTGVQTEDKVVGPSFEDLTPVEQFFDCKEPDSALVQASHPGRRLERLSSSSRFLSEDASRCSTRPSKKRFYSPQAILIYAALLLFVGQLSALAYLLSVAIVIPPGMVFLISAVCYIGFVMMRILFDEYRKMNLPKSTTGHPSTTTTVALVPVVASRKHHNVKGLHPILVAIGKQLASIVQQEHRDQGSQLSRKSRSSTVPSNRSSHRLLCDDSKTISKMKIL